MLMIVVVIIIAAVAAGFAGSMAGSPVKKVPSLILDVKVVNTGFWFSESGFLATVSSISRPVPTNELKIVTSWTITNRTTGELETGGNTVVPLVTNIDINPCYNSWPRRLFQTPMTAPFGSGPGVTGWPLSNAVPGYYVSEQFGEYTLEPGTSMSAPAQHCTCNCLFSSNGVCASSPCTGTYGGGGAGQYSYSACYDGAPYTDSATAVLGQGWNNLRAGDTVNVKVIHLSTNSIIFNKNILVTEG